MSLAIMDRIATTHVSVNVIWNCYLKSAASPPVRGLCDLKVTFLPQKLCSCGQC